MTKFFGILGDNPIITAIITASILGGVAWLWRKYAEGRDSKIVYEFLVASSAGPYNFRSTEAIASHTNLSEARVADMCAIHAKIRRNENEKQSWTLVD